MISSSEVEVMIRKALPGSKVSVADSTGTGDHFDVLVESALFHGRSLIEQHQLVHAALAPEMDKRIHAVRIKTRVV